MASTKSIIRPLLCLVLVIAPAIMAAADFEPLLQKLEAALSAAITLEAATDAQKSNINDNSPPASDFTSKASSIAALDAFIPILNANKQQLLTDTSQMLSHKNLVNAASHSVSPYGSNTNTRLADFLLDAKTKSVTEMEKARFAADTGNTRYVEIIDDMNLQKSNLFNAATAADINAAVIEAQDEVVEGIPDGSSRLEVAREGLDKVVGEITLRLKDVAAELRTITNPNPAFSAYLNTFKDAY